MGNCSEIVVVVHSSEVGLLHRGDGFDLIGEIGMLHCGSGIDLQLGSGELYVGG